MSDVDNDELFMSGINIMGLLAVGCLEIEAV